ncbi:hypothetical protein EUGRSUZ_C04288 [Eucalyptus grandis]|uniref:Uncharacterized protein n=2 Tax=Eucalyptus grandis TaxID=71139 RepID=A0ACC3LKX7_EUCGR|nr:hypothetical protein EUGRSUZ_C04288 [Eucalyptus grandis]
MGSRMMFITLNPSPFISFHNQNMYQINQCAHKYIWGHNQAILGSIHFDYISCNLNLDSGTRMPDSVFKLVWTVIETWHHQVIFV